MMDLLLFIGGGVLALLIIGVIFFGITSIFGMGLGGIIFGVLFLIVAFIVILCVV